MRRNRLTELQPDTASHLLMTPMIGKEAIDSCRDHLESIQNLRYLISLEIHDPQQVKLHLRMMDWHLNNLGEVLFQLDS